MVNTAGYLAFNHEVADGFNSTLVFKCTKCCEIRKIKTNPYEQRTGNINFALTWGTIASGKGYSALQDIFTVGDIPLLGKDAFFKYQQTVGEVCENTLIQVFMWFLYIYIHTLSRRG